jgi:hypothetical protein
MTGPFPAQGPILETDYVNTPRSPRDRRADWPKWLVGGKTFLSPGANRYAYVSVHDPDSEYDSPLTGLSGTAIKPETSPSDNPFLHPFGNDFEFYLAPDPPYYELAAPRTSKTWQDYIDATAVANTKYGLNVPAVLGVEWDGGLVPTQFRAKEGDRVALWGRWIVDVGHDDFHTEIHPPVIMATARPARSTQQGGGTGSGDATIVSILTRPYLVSQEFASGGLFEHLATEAGKVLGFASTQIQAHPHLLSVPFQGLNIVTFKVRPPTTRQDFKDVLMAEFSMTRRDDSVAIQLLRGSDGESVRVILVLNEAGYVPPPVPDAVTHTVTLEELDKDSSTAGNAYRGAIFAAVLLAPHAAAVLKRGIKSTKFVKPKAPTLGPTTRVKVDDLRPVKTKIDVNQPFPLFGTLKVEWQRAAGVVSPQPPPQARRARSRTKPRTAR